jgi:O-antigen/teichoic acid export membrane protein
VTEPALSTSPSSLARRSLTSLTWNTFASLVTLPVSFTQTVLLARLLPVEYFGIFGGLTAIINLSYPVFEFGLSAAALHRAPETEDEEKAIAIFFTLRLILSSLWAMLLTIFAWLALDGQRRTVFLVMTAAAWAMYTSVAGQVLLIRRVQHRRLAIGDILQTVVVFVVTLLIAYLTGSIYALVIAPAVQALINWILFFIYRPVWRPRLLWEAAAVRYFLSFGWKVMGGVTISVALDYLDDLWTAVFLGDRALGYYSRAYRFATYPRLILSEPVNSVSTGMYAELKFDRPRLSQAFYQVNALLLRSGFLMAGWLTLIAPQFIRLFLGDKWLPMLEAFRLMLLYAMLSPIRNTVSNVLIAVGKPEQASLSRLAQLIALVIGLFALGPSLGIQGVALAVDFMLVVGLVSLFIYVRWYVDFSLKRLFVVPGVALAIGLVAGTLSTHVVGLPSSDWWRLIIQSIVYFIVYSALLFALEGKELRHTVQETLKIIGQPERLP